eukprot:gene8620-8801_t
MQSFAAPACPPPEETSSEEASSEDELLEDEEGTEFQAFDDHADIIGNAAVNSVVLASLAQGHLVRLGSGADGTVSVLAPPALNLCRNAACSSSSFCKICIQARKHVVKLYHNVEELQHAQQLGSNLLDRVLEVPELLRTNLMGLASSGQASCFASLFEWHMCCFDQLEQFLQQHHCSLARDFKVADAVALGVQLVAALLLRIIDCDSAAKAGTPVSLQVGTEGWRLYPDLLKENSQPLVMACTAMDLHPALGKLLAYLVAYVIGTSAGPLKQLSHHELLGVRLLGQVQSQYSDKGNAARCFKDCMSLEELLKQLMELLHDCGSKGAAYLELFSGSTGFAAATDATALPGAATAATAALGPDLPWVPTAPAAVLPPPAAANLAVLASLPGCSDASYALTALSGAAAPLTFGGHSPASTDVVATADTRSASANPAPVKKVRTQQPAVMCALASAACDASGQQASQAMPEPVAGISHPAGDGVALADQQAPGAHHVPHLQQQQPLQQPASPLHTPLTSYLYGVRLWWQGSGGCNSNVSVFIDQAEQWYEFVLRLLQLGVLVELSEADKEQRQPGNRQVTRFVWRTTLRFSAKALPHLTADELAADSMMSEEDLVASDLAIEQGDAFEASLGRTLQITAVSIFQLESDGRQEELMAGIGVGCFPVGSFSSKSLAQSFRLAVHRCKVALLVCWKTQLLPLQDQPQVLQQLRSLMP